MEPKLAKLMDDGRFDEATALLKRHIAEAEIMDARDDATWGPTLDVLGYRILAEKGAEAFLAFWEDFLEFFEKELEPAWGGHLHKGHLLMRIAAARFHQGGAAARETYVEMLAEDHLAARVVADNVQVSAGALGLAFPSYATTELYDPADRERATDVLTERFPSYTALCILERIDDGYFASTEEMERFYRGMVPVQFELIWARSEVEPSVARQALRTVLPPQGCDPVLRLRDELELATAHESQVTSVILVGALLEAILFNVLYHRLEVRTIAEKRIQQAGLGELLREALGRDVFPTETIRSTCQLIYIARNELYRAAEKAYEYEVNPNAASLIGLTLKIFLDLALVSWAEALAD
jgi:hypothetical protein